MPDTLNQWAARWRIPEAALVDLRTQLAPPAPVVAVKSGSEASVQQGVRLAAAKRGILLWRNNVGAAMDQWAGYRVLAGDNERVQQRRFFHQFGVDVLTAQALPAREADTLRATIESNYFT